MSLKIGLLAVLAAAILTLSASAFASPQARIASACSVGSGEGYGYAYLTSLSVKRTSCSTGKSLVRHKGRLRGWHCSRKVLQRSSGCRRTSRLCALSCSARWRRTAPDRSIASPSSGTRGPSHGSGPWLRRHSDGSGCKP